MIMVHEFYRCKDIPLPINESWDDFQNAYFEHISTGRKADISLVESILNSSTYEHFDNIECGNLDDEMATP